MSRLYAPWERKQVRLLNRFQRADALCSLCCPRHQGRELRATRGGWVCTDRDCDYRQYWAHAFMVDVEVIAQAEAERRQLDAQLEELLHRLLRSS